MALDFFTARVSCSGSLAGGEVWANVWHIRADGEPANDVLVPPAPQDIADAFETFYTDIAGLLSAPTTLNRIVISNLGNEGDGPHEFEPAVVGTGGNNPLPTQNAVCVTLRTGVATKNGRGRVFLPGFDESSSGGANDLLLTTARNTIITAVQNLQIALSPVYSIAVYSRVQTIARDVTQVRVGGVYDTIRRRRNRRVEGYVSAALP